MLVGKLGALVRRGKTFALSCHLKGWSPSLRASNEQYSLLRSLRSSAYGNSPISGYSSFYGFKFLSKNLNVPSTRKITTPAAVLHSAKVEATNSGIKVLVFGPHARKQVSIWLFICAFCVFYVIYSGGITRQARSALSTSDLEFMRLTDDGWNHEFEKYMQSPGCKCVKTLSDFKYIHGAKFVHRDLGIVLGFVFCLPFAYFLSKGYITRPLGLRLSLLFALGGAQALFGCLPTVKSSPEEPAASEYVQLRASPYRYAMFITSAFILYGGILWNALSVKKPEPPTGSLEWVRGAAKLRKLLLPVYALVGITALSGAFVAGNCTGHEFSTLPKKGNSRIPGGDSEMAKPLFRNFFENAVATIQLNHGLLATATLLWLTSLWWRSYKIELHPAIRLAVAAVAAAAYVQALVDISYAHKDHVPYFLGTAGTAYVQALAAGINLPFFLGADHQLQALVLLSLMTFLAHCVRKPSPHVLKSLASLPNIKS